MKDRSLEEVVRNNSNINKTIDRVNAIKLHQSAIEIDLNNLYNFLKECGESTYHIKTCIKNMEYCARSVDVVINELKGRLTMPNKALEDAAKLLQAYKINQDECEESN